nr:glycoside hydrolase N-terminal domain-containing protein [Saccharibacillus qingshengii]
MNRKSEGTSTYARGNHAVTYAELPLLHPGREWREGMVSGNGENGYITAGSPYADTFIFQHMAFNYPSADPREIPPELQSQLEEAREHVFRQDDRWTIKFPDGSKRRRTFLYSYHPGHQLRLHTVRRQKMSAYERWTNHETAETGVRYVDEDGEWIRTSFTSRVDNVSITRIQSSSREARINLILSIDDISQMCKAQDRESEVTALRYKKQVGANADYIAQVVHYPAYAGSELIEGGYAGLTRVIAVGGNKESIRLTDTNEAMNVGEVRNSAIRVTDAEAVYLITQCDRTFELGPIEVFADASVYGIVESLAERTQAVADRYGSAAAGFDYDRALAEHAKLHAAAFNAVRFDLHGDEMPGNADNAALIAAQRNSPTKMVPAFIRRMYDQGRYALICCGGMSAPRLCGMWTGEWNPGWRGIYTLDANVNLQVSPMNTGHSIPMPLGYIAFFLRNAPDFADNARMAYGMHGALQVSVNSDGDRAMHVEYDNDYPFQYWNAGASWCLLPIYEYWQCFGNRRIPIQESMNIHALRLILSVSGMERSEEAWNLLIQGGELDLETDILLPLLTRQSHFWEQLCTPAYFMDASGRSRHEPGKTALASGEKYMLIPTYSPENAPIGYTSTLTANATMDISAARDGLHMTIAVEKAVKREGYEEAVRRWESLLQQLPDYRLEPSGALREWAIDAYTENNDHRHLSHLYPAWPAYETQSDPQLAEACRRAILNRDRFNTGDNTAGHSWMHKALVYARLKNGEGAAADDCGRRLLHVPDDGSRYEPPMRHVLHRYAVWHGERGQRSPAVLEYRRDRDPAGAAAGLGRRPRRRPDGQNPDRGQRVVVESGRPPGKRDPDLARRRQSNSVEIGESLDRGVGGRPTGRRSPGRSGFQCAVAAAGRRGG